MWRISFTVETIKCLSVGAICSPAHRVMICSCILQEWICSCVVNIPGIVSTHVETVCLLSQNKESPAEAFPITGSPALCPVMKSASPLYERIPGESK